MGEWRGGLEEMVSLSGVLRPSFMPLIPLELHVAWRRSFGGEGNDCGGAELSEWVDTRLSLRQEKQRTLASQLAAVPHFATDFTER